jgi:hypothetical protein
MESANPGSIGDGASQLRERLAIPLNAALIGNAAMFIGAIKVTAAALSDLHSGMVVLL